MINELKKRDCNIQMNLIPRGAGWLHMHLHIGDEKIGFVISSALGDRFERLLRLMYHLYPDNNDPEFEENVYCWQGLCKWSDDKDDYEVVKIVERITDEPYPHTFRDIPWKAELCWDAEGSDCQWVIEREPTLETDFNIKLHIKYSDEENERCYEVRYKDFCYAISKACTEVIKTHGIMGYHQSTYEEDIPLRYLLYLKAIALDKLDWLRLQDVEDEQWAYSSNFEKEMELLLFDM